MLSCIILQLLIVFANSRNCYRVVPKTRSVIQYRTTSYHEYYHCGLRTCSRTIYGMSSSMIYKMIYVNESVCCPGYFQSNDDCIPICNSTCTNGTICISPNVCDCGPGWTGQNCETDINECAEGGNNCDQECNNTMGSYSCSCNTSTILNSNGYQCDDVDECALDHNCSTRCVNTYGSFHCTCDPGFILNSDGQTCRDANECRDGSHQCEQICINTIGSHDCACFPNHTLLSNLRNCLGPPQNVSFSDMNSTTLLLTWNMPDSDTVDGDVLLYSIRCTSHQNINFIYNESLTASQHRHVVLHSLQPFTTYTCCVSAHTTGGISPTECLLQQTLEAVPSAVTGVVVQVTSSRSISVSWDPPARTNGILLNYTVRVYTNTSLDNTTVINILPHHSRSVNIYNLIPYIPYVVAVTASTKAGESDNWIELIYTEYGVPDVSAVVLRTNSTTARIQSHFQMPEVAALILTSLTVIYIPAVSDVCPSQINENMKHATAKDVSIQTETATLSGLAVSEEYCVAVKLSTVSGGIAYSPVLKLSLPSNVYIQIRLRLSNETCAIFTKTSSKTKLNSVSSALLDEVLATCNCSYSMDHITLSRLLCGHNQQEVIYQTHLLNTPDILAEDLVTLIQQWIQSRLLIAVGGDFLQVNLYCHVRLMELGRIDECFSVNPTEGIKRVDDSIHITIGGILGAVGGAVTLFLIAVCIGTLARELYLSREKRILNDRNLRITRGENYYVNCGFIPEEKTTYHMHR